VSPRSPLILALGWAARLPPGREDTGSLTRSRLHSARAALHGRTVPTFALSAPTCRFWRATRWHGRCSAGAIMIVATLVASLIAAEPNYPLPVSERDTPTARPRSKSRQRIVDLGGAMFGAGAAGVVTFGFLYLLADHIDHQPPLFAGWCFSDDSACPAWQYGGPSPATQALQMLTTVSAIVGGLGAVMAVAALSTDADPVGDATVRHPATPATGVSWSASPFRLNGGAGLALSARF
jgi:hypothetical protein